MKHERIYFYPEDKRVYIDTYVVIDNRVSARDAMIVIPGGAYAGVCADREGENVGRIVCAVDGYFVKLTQFRDSIFQQLAFLGNVILKSRGYFLTGRSKAEYDRGSFRAAAKSAFLTAALQ